MYTSDVSGAGTDANVWVVLYGESGQDTGRLKLDNKNNNFERNMKDVFEVCVVYGGCVFVCAC